MTPDVTATAIRRLRLIVLAMGEGIPLASNTENAAKVSADVAVLEQALADARRQAVEGSEPPGCPTPGACSCPPAPRSGS